MRRLAVFLVLPLMVSACLFMGSTGISKPAQPKPESIEVERPSEKRKTIRGMASFYGSRFQGKTTASGEVFDKDALTAAHRTLPFGTRLKVKNIENGKSVVVRINDRGPFVKGRVLDLSKEAARQLGILVDGVVQVEAEVLQ
jgi:rare lipoprotein A